MSTGLEKHLSWESSPKDAYQPLLRLISENNKKCFIKFLETRYEPWQVAQAEEAIKLYNYFFSISQKSSEEPAEAARISPQRLTP